MYLNTATKTSKVQTIIHKHILPKGRNNPLELTSRSSQPADRIDQPNDWTVRSNLLFDRPDCSTHLHLFAFPRYSSLYRRTIQANLLSALPSIHNQSL
ncbi:hypothetical protein Hanom_Chr08g00742471 [Helianthus anomalus]